MTMPVAFIEFLTPLFLAGGTAVAIPFLIHLLARQRAPEHPFSTLRFLRKSVEKTARRRRLRDLFLLIVRMAVVALLAAALARPLLTGTGGLFRDQSTAVAIILDNSPSMALADGGDVRFERARTAALRILGRLQEKDQAALILTSGQTAAQGDLYRQIENVERLVDEAVVGISAADIPAALAEARAILAGSDSPNRELFLITDLQRSNWRDAPDADPAGSGTDAKSEPAEAVVVVDVHRERPINVAVESIEVRGAVPAVGLPLEVRGTLRNAAPVLQSVQVELFVGDEIVQRPPPVRLAAGEQRALSLDYRPELAGIHVGRMRVVGEDASALDNERWFVVDTQSPVQVALVDDRQEGEPLYRSASFYLERALRPTDAGPYAIEVTTLKPELLAAEPLSSYGVIVCADLRPPNDAGCKALQDYVSAGGTLLWTCGPNTDPGALTERAHQEELFVGTFSFPEQGEQRGTHWAYLDDTHPLFAPLATPPSLYRSVTVDRYVRLELPADSPARVIARLDSGDPALEVHAFGRGQVWVLTCGAHANWTTLPLRPIFVPLVNRLVLGTADRDRGPLEVSPGAPATLRFADEPEAVTVEVTSPQQPEPTQIKTAAVDGVQTFQFGATKTTGVYHLRTLDGVHPRQFAFAVNPASAEADPAVVPEQELEQRCGHPILLAHDADEVETVLQRLHEGTPLMDLFLVVVLVVGLAEILVANRAGGQEPLARPTTSHDRVRAILGRAQSLHHLERFAAPGKARLR